MPQSNLFVFLDNFMGHLAKIHCTKRGDEIPTDEVIRDSLSLRGGGRGFCSYKCYIFRQSWIIVSYLKLTG